MLNVSIPPRRSLRLGTAAFPVSPGTGIWTLAELFAQGQNGLWGEPEPQYLYLTSAGTTNVSANNDPVGLGLDRHKGLTLGPQEVTSPNFSSADGFATSGGWTISGGQAVVTGAAGGDAVTVAGLDAINTRRVEVVIDVESVSGSADVRSSGGGGGNTVYKVLAVGTNRVLIKSPNPDVNIQVVASAGASATLNSFSIRELPGNHLAQSTSADRPTYNTDGTLHWLEFDGAGDHLVLPDDVGVAGGQDRTISIAVGSITPGTVTYLWNFGTYTDFGTRLSLRASATGFYRLEAGGVGEDTDIPIASAGEAHVVTVRLSGGDFSGLSLKANGQIYQFTQNTTLSTATGDNRLATGFTDSQEVAARVYGYVFREGYLDGGDFDRMERYLAKLAGITL